MDERKFSDIVETPASFGQVEEAPAATPETPKPEASGQQRDDKGRYASNVPPEPTAETPKADAGVKTEPTPPVAPTNSQPPPGHVPLAAVLDEREKRSAIKRQLDEANARIAEFERQQADEPPPDFFADPDKAFDTRMNSRLEQTINPLQQQLIETRSALLEERLIRVAGPEKASLIEAEIRKAMESGDQSILILSNSLQTKGPAAVADLVDWYDKRTFDPVSFEANLRAKILAEMQQKPAGTQPTAAPVTPPSMAAVAAGGAPAKDVEQTATGKFEQMFNR